MSCCRVHEASFRRGNCTRCCSGSIQSISSRNAAAASWNQRTGSQSHNEWCQSCQPTASLLIDLLLSPMSVEDMHLGLYSGPIKLPTAFICVWRGSHSVGLFGRNLIVWVPMSIFKVAYHSGSKHMISHEVIPDIEYSKDSVQ